MVGAITRKVYRDLEGSIHSQVWAKVLGRWPQPPNRAYCTFVAHLGAWGWKTTVTDALISKKAQEVQFFLHH